MSDEEQYALGNDWERPVIGNTEELSETNLPREYNRYKFAATFIKEGMSVLEFGCASGYGTKILPSSIDYTGVDYDAGIVEFAKKNFEDSSHKFVQSGIEEFLETNTRKYDIIIAYEILEHIARGKEVAQELKKHCSTLIISTPYNEFPGFWGKHHVLHHLKAKDFPSFYYIYMHVDGSLHDTPTQEPTNLLIMTWEEGKEYSNKKTILCAIPTRDRYDCLMLTLQSVAFQTVKPDKIIIYDDSPNKMDVREHVVGRYLLPLLSQKGIEWEVVFTPGRGQHIAHQLSNTSGYDYVWRLDDDTIAEPDVLERLVKILGSSTDIGASAGAVYEPDRIVFGDATKKEHFFDRNNVQWAPNHGIYEVEWLYSSFLYRAGITNYKHNMSPAAFHEESIFSHRLRLAGYRLIVDTTIHTYHYKARTGGTRTGNPDMEWAYNWDQVEFNKIIENEWGMKLIHLGVGLGDNIVFSRILPELKKKYPIIVLGSCYPEVFQDMGVHFISVERSTELNGDNIYDWMSERDWKGSIEEAYRRMYLL
jgi:hypothetical protein